MDYTVVSDVKGDDECMKLTKGYGPAEAGLIDFARLEFYRNEMVWVVDNPFLNLEENINSNVVHSYITKVVTPLKQSMDTPILGLFPVEKFCQDNFIEILYDIPLAPELLYVDGYGLLKVSEDSAIVLHIDDFVLTTQGNSIDNMDIWFRVPPYVGNLKIVGANLDTLNLSKLSELIVPGIFYGDKVKRLKTIPRCLNGVKCSQYTRSLQGIHSLTRPKFRDILGLLKQFDDDVDDYDEECSRRI